MSDRQPSALTAWIRDNLALTITICSLVFGSIGFLIATTAKVTTVQRDIADSAEKIVVLQGNVVDVDRRLVAIVEKEREAETDIDQRLSAAHEKVALLEQVLATIADRTAREPLSQPRSVK